MSHTGEREGFFLFSQSEFLIVHILTFCSPLRYTVKWMPCDEQTYSVQSLECFFSHFWIADVLNRNSVFYTSWSRAFKRV